MKTDRPEYPNITINGVKCRLQYTRPAKDRGIYDKSPLWDLTISVGESEAYDALDAFDALMALLGPPSLPKTLRHEAGTNLKHDRDYCPVCSARENEAIGVRGEA